jgi:hypothetical protein
LPQAVKLGSLLLRTREATYWNLMLLLCTHGDAHQETQDHKIIARCTRNRTRLQLFQLLGAPRHSSPGCIVSTSTTPYVATTRSRPHRFYINYAVHRDYSSSGCTGSTSTTPCARSAHLSARLLVDRSHWLSSCVRSLCLAVRLLVVRIALALLRLCRASGRVVSMLNFSSVGRIGCRRVPGHSVVHRDYPSRGRNRYTSPTPRV